MANEWFYAQDGQKFGPVTGKRLKELATLGIVRRNDLIWSPGYSVWRPAKKFRGLLPKMDATSFNPAMSLFWKPVDLEADGDKQGKVPFLEPDAPATAITPALPGTVLTSPARPAHGSRRAELARRTAARRALVAAAISEVAKSPPPTPGSIGVATRRSPAAPAAAAPIEVPKPETAGMSAKEKALIGAGLCALLLIYGALMLRALI